MRLGKNSEAPYHNNSNIFRRPSASPFINQQRYPNLVSKDNRLSFASMKAG